MSRTFVVGTAGHVDHGKSSLVRALTGTDPDRLAEEQLRQMTIDLGFAELETPAKNRVHIVDVPGHERFVRNMLAGAGGIDAAILAIAADDGPMPQTREHLAILDLLGIEHGVVALTKADLVDGEWLGFVAESIRELLAETALADVEIVPVSSVTGMGLIDLQHALDRTLAGFARSVAIQPARLPIDRVFSISGFGTIITGTLNGAPLRVGDRVEVLPGGRSARIRGLQSFGEPVDEAAAGSRVAVNLSGLVVTELARGDLLCHPGELHPAMRLDARVRLLTSSERSLRQNDELIVFAGSAELPARIAILEGDTLEPGEGGWVQFRFARPIVVHPGDRFVVRRPSPPETIGGGTVIELDPARHKRNQPGVIARLETLALGDPADRLLAWIGSRFIDERQLPVLQSGVVDATRIAEWLLAEGRLRRIGPYLASSTRVEDVTTMSIERVREFHHANPLDAGMPRELLRDAIQLDRPVFDAILADASDLEIDGPIVRQVGFHIVLDADRRRRANAYLAHLFVAGFQPPTPEEAGIDPDLARALANLGSIVEIGDGIVMLPERVDEAAHILSIALAESTSISLAEYRDRLETTRRYAQALLEYFDRQRVTRRVGDRRVAVRSIAHIEDAMTQ
jgi:selenocysteine-specific elongation factor